MMSRFGGKIVLVTGAASGIGAAVARQLREGGAHVLAADIVDICTTGAQEEGIECVRLDVTKETDWEKVIGDIMVRHHRLDVLVNNAGVVGPVDDLNLERLSLESWREVFRINVEGAFLGCRTSLRALKESKAGVIVNIASIAAVRATPHAPAYGASKAALHHLTLSVAQYCAEQALGVRCCSVMPGDVRTPLWDRMAGERATDDQGSAQFFEDLVRSIPLGDLASSADIAAAVAFLVSDEARNITAMPLIVDGGVTGCASFASRRWRRSNSDIRRSREPSQ